MENEAHTQYPGNYRAEPMGTVKKETGKLEDILCR